MDEESYQQMKLGDGPGTSVCRDVNLKAVYSMFRLSGNQRSVTRFDREAQASHLRFNFYYLFGSLIIYFLRDGI